MAGSKVERNRGQGPEPGSIEDIAGRLALWAGDVTKGLAWVNAEPGPARERVIGRLQNLLVEKGIPFNEMRFKPASPPHGRAREIRDWLDTLEGGVASISGFESAFQNDRMLREGLDDLNFSRELIERPPVLQIWWLPPDLAEAFPRLAPDLNAWFLVRLELKERLPYLAKAYVAKAGVAKAGGATAGGAKAGVELDEPIGLRGEEGRQSANIDEARSRARALEERFTRALRNATWREIPTLRRQFVELAEKALLDAESPAEAMRVRQGFEQAIQARLAEIPARYDFFMSYRHGGKDEAFARDIFKRLEAAGFKGAIDKRDFGANQRFLAEMERCIRESRFTLSVISPRYVYSQNCVEEAVICKVLDMAERKARLIPLLLESVDLPVWLHDITGVDFTEEDPLVAPFEKLVKALGERQQVPAPQQPCTKRHHNLPPRNPFFTGREKVLEDVHKAFEESNTAGLTQVHGISGLGGLGKSQTALEYAYRHLGADYDVALWMRADTENELHTGFFEAARLLGVAGEGSPPNEATLAAVKAWLEGHSRWLLVLDNVEGGRQDLVKPYLPHGQGGLVLMTSRAAQLDALSVPKPIALDAMEPDEARDFLYRRTQRKEGTEEEAVRAIAETLGYLPLALDQAAAHIVVMGCAFAAYQKSFEKRRKAFLAHKPEAGDYPDTVATTWSMNFEEVGKTAKASADLLRFAAFLDPDRIPFELLVQGAPELGSPLAAALAQADEDPIELNEVLEPLCRYSLIRVDQADESFTIHRLVQQAMRDRLNAKDEAKWAERTVRAVSAAFPSGEFETWPMCERLLPHAFAALDLIENHGFEIAPAARLSHHTGYFLKERGRYAEAESFHRRALEIMERALGPHRPELAAPLNNLALVYEAEGRYDEAERLYGRAITIREKALGPRHPDVAALVNNLAELYRVRGRYADAEPLYRRALDIREETLGSDHPNIAVTLNNLGNLYLTLGRREEAEPLYQRALRIREKMLGPEHPDLANSLNNLANVCAALGRYDDAEQLFKRAQTICERSLGPNHPNLARTLNNLGEVHRIQGRYEDAKGCYRRALTIYEQSLGGRHPSVATLLNNLGLLCYNQAHYAEAESFYQRALDIIGGTLGSEHREFASTLHNLALLRKAQGRYAEAEPLYQGALAIWEKALPADHPHLEAGCANYAALLRAMGRDAEAEEYEARSAAIKKQRGE